MDRKNYNTKATSVLRTIRSLAPDRRLSVDEAMRVAELQAGRLLNAQGVTQAPVPDDVVASQQRVCVEYDFDMPATASGTCHWDTSRRVWRVVINGQQTETRQRFTLIHEYKHILDHGHPGLCEKTPRHYYGLPADEFIADYFAGCVLMPRFFVKQAWNSGVQDIEELATRFDVSTRAMEVRLGQLKLVAAVPHQPGRHGSEEELAA